MRALVGPRSSGLLVCALLLLAPWLVAAHGPVAGRQAGDQGAGSVAVGGVLVPGIASVASLNIPQEQRNFKAELEWGGDAMGWCRFVPEMWPGDPAAALNVGSERIVAERFTRDEHGDTTANADVSDRLPGILGPDGRTVVVRGMTSGFGDPCWGKWRLRVSWQVPAEPAGQSPQQAQVELSIGDIVLPSDADAALVPVTVHNPSSVPLVDVKVTGKPPACRREIGELAPGQSITYTCRARPGERVDLTVNGTGVSGGAVDDSARTVSATAHAVAPTVPPPPRAVQLSAAPPVPEPAESAGVRESPARTAGIIAVLGVLVMTVSVGALSSATRIGR